MWRSEDNQQGLVLSLYHVGFSDLSQMVGLGGKCLSLLNLLAGPGIFLDLVNLHSGSLLKRRRLDFNTELTVILWALAMAFETFQAFPSLQFVVCIPQRSGFSLCVLSAAVALPAGVCSPVLWRWIACSSI